MISPSQYRQEERRGGAGCDWLECCSHSAVATHCLCRPEQFSVLPMSSSCTRLQGGVGSQRWPAVIGCGVILTACRLWSGISCLPWQLAVVFTRPPGQVTDKIEMDGRVVIEQGSSIVPFRESAITPQYSKEREGGGQNGTFQQPVTLIAPHFRLVVLDP